MKFAVAALGSTGDLYPFLAIACALARRGHDVTLLGQAPYESQVLAEGIGFRAVVGSADHRRTLDHPLLWHPLHGFGVLWRHLAAPAIEPTCQALGELAHTSGGAEPLTVLATPIAAGARFARDRWPERIRLLSGYTAPLGLRHSGDPMFVGPWQVPRWAPPWLRARLWALLDRWKLEPMARPTLQRWQQSWGTPALPASIFADWLHSPDGGLALYPDWFATVPDPWRARRVRQFDFPFFEPSVSLRVPDDVTAFIERHPRYIVVYPGSAAADAERMFNFVAPACGQLDLAAIVLAPHLKSSPEGTSDDQGALLTVAPQLPLAAILPNARAFVHHGGIGSLAQGFRHAIPQLVLASAYDQFENGARLELVGAGRWRRTDRVTPAEVGADLRALVEADVSMNFVHRQPSPVAIDTICNHLLARG